MGFDIDYNKIHVSSFLCSLSTHNATNQCSPETNFTSIKSNRAIDQLFATFPAYLKSFGVHLHTKLFLHVRTLCSAHQVFKAHVDNFLRRTFFRTEEDTRRQIRAI